MALNTEAKGGCLARAIGDHTVVQPSVFHLCSVCVCVCKCVCVCAHMHVGR